MATFEYYAYLGVEQHADDAQIKTSYRRLAWLYHPDRNNNSHEAKEKFQKLHEAYSTLIDAEKRRQYNLKVPSLRTQQAKPQETTGSSSASRTTTSEDTELRRFREVLEAINQELQVLYPCLTQVRKVIKDKQARVDAISAAMAKLDVEELEDKAAEDVRDGWYHYFFGKKESAVEIEKRDRQRTERQAARNLHERLLEEIQNEMARLQKGLFELQRIIKTKEEHRESEQRHKKKYEKKINAAKRAREKSEKKVQERRQKEEAQARRARHEESQNEREARQHQNEDELRRGGPPKRRENERKEPDGCRHQGWWIQVEGKYQCKECNMVTTCFAFHCQDCQAIACAQCMHMLKEQ